MNALLQDHDGYLWTGTFGGLARFDGERFRVLGSADMPGRGSLRIISLYESCGSVLRAAVLCGCITALPSHTPSAKASRAGSSAPSAEMPNGTSGSTLRGAVAHFAGAKLEVCAIHRRKAVREFYLQEGARAGHWGLPGIRERAKRIGARLQLWSESGAGTEVELTVLASVAYAASHARRRFGIFRIKTKTS